MLKRPKNLYLFHTFNPMNQQNPWQTKSSKKIYENPWISLTEHQVINPSGGKGIYGEVHFKNYAIGIIAIDEDDLIYLVGQYRYPLKKYSWELPEGGGPLDQEPLDSAKRELLEETGLVAQHWEEVLRMHLSNSVSNELGILYLAKDFEQFEAQPEETEQLEVKKIPFEEAYQMVIKGEITDSLTVAGILRVKLMMQGL
jgi:8-oxo-dGTP pyrophosphatase MutT (NUDIX family)